jgi:hypothetical protein
MSMPDIPADPRSLFDDAELAEIEANELTLGDTRRDTADLAAAWAANVRKIDLDRALPSSDRSVWTEHDLAGALFLRDHLHSSLSRLRPELKAKMERYVTGVDEHFRSFTVADSGKRMGVVADVDLTGRAWWWFRVPDSGPIAEDLSRYPG